MTDKPTPLFLERRSYRQRRLVDAARLLPVLGAVLFGLPVLWPKGGGAGLPTSSAILYLFGVWGILVGLTLVISRRLEDNAPAAPQDGQGEGPP